MAHALKRDEAEPAAVALFLVLVAAGVLALCVWSQRRSAEPWARRLAPGRGNAVRRLRVIDDAGTAVPVTLRLSLLPPVSGRPR